MQTTPSIERKPSQIAFTLKELLALLAVFALLILIGVPKLAEARKRAKRIHCVSRLKNMGLSFRIFASDNHELYPTQVYTNWIEAETNLVGYFQSISNELSTAVLLRCPQDKGKVPVKSFASLSVANISYFINLNASEDFHNDFLFGDRNLEGAPVSNSIMRIPTNNTSLRWSREIHQFQGNVALADGSVAQTSSTIIARFPANFSSPQRLLIPGP